MKNKELSITPTKKPQSPLFDLEAFQLFILDFYFEQYLCSLTVSIKYFNQPL